ncbi:MAG TPA: hypothetical protein VFO40_27355 [Chthoniobacterales bacterium]|nr:hypothetical protein [Chthoniobacterales bacterium]
MILSEHGNARWQRSRRVPLKSILFVLALGLIAPLQASQVVITHGGSYTGPIAYNTNPGQAAIKIATTQLVYLERCTIYSAGTGIEATGGNQSLWLTTAPNGCCQPVTASRYTSQLFSSCSIA